MEEQKNSKEVKMEVTNQSNQENMPTFDELYKAYMDLANKHQLAIQKLQQADRYIQTFNRLDYLFKIVEIQDANKSGRTFKDDFYYKCVEEIEEMMTIPEENSKDVKEN